MGSIKWLGGLLGWVTGGPIGALLGFFLGSAAERSITVFRQIGGSTPNDGDGPHQRSYGPGATGERSYRTGGYSATEQRNSFMMSLLVLSSAVIRADGRTMHSEMEYVKSFIRANFGDTAVDEAMDILRNLNRQQINVYSVGAQIGTYMNYSQRLQLFHYLAELANADKCFCKEEKDVLEAIAGAIGISAGDAASVIAMFYKDTDSAYAVLEISPSATDEEVKSAYRRMAMKNHPDKVATLGEDVRKSAEEKFRKIQEAYETIKQQRGIS